MRQSSYLKVMESLWNLFKILFMAKEETWKIVSSKDTEEGKKWVIYYLFPKEFISLSRLVTYKCRFTTSKYEDIVHGRYRKKLW